MEKLNRLEFVNSVIKGMPQSTLTIATIQKLPLTIHFLASNAIQDKTNDVDSASILSQLIEEQTKTLQLEYLQKHLQNYQDKNGINDYHFFSMESNFKSKLESNRKDTTKAVEKYYRKLVIQIHPDRMGEHYRHPFESLKDAKEILVDPDLRNMYFTQMAHILDCFENNEGLIHNSHYLFLQTHRPGMAENIVRRNDAVLRERAIEGGLTHQQPRMPRVYITNEQERRIKIYLPALKPVYDFYEYYFKGVEVRFTCSTLQRGIKMAKGKQMKMEYTIRRTRQDLIAIHGGEGLVLQNDSLYLGEEILPHYGQWYISWKAKLNNNIIEAEYEVSSLESPESRDVGLELFDQKLIARFIKCEEVEKKVVLNAKKLDCAINQLRGIRPSDNFQKYQDFHNIVVKASSSLRHMSEMLNSTNQENQFNDSGSAYSQLNRSLESAKDKLNELQQYRNGLYKKDKLKQFKCFVANVLESENVCSWMEIVTNQELEAEGGSANRLYQLFKEGKGSFVLHLEPELLRVVSKRSDLFSTKQCNDFMDRSKELELKEKKEEEKLKEAKKKREHVEAERKMILLEIKRAWIGSHIIFQELSSKSGKKYNGKLGLVLDYLEEEDQFKVQYCGALNEEWNEDNDTQIFVVKQDNLKKYFGPVPTQSPPRPLPEPPTPPPEPQSQPQLYHIQLNEEIEVNLASKQQELLDILFQDAQLDQLNEANDSRQEQHYIEPSVITNSTQCHKKHTQQYTQEKVYSDNDKISALSMEIASRRSERENRPPVVNMNIPITRSNTSDPQRIHTKKSKRKKNKSSKQSMSYKENSTISSNLTVSSIDLSTNSKAFDPVSGKALCRFGNSCRKQSCRFYHPEVAKSISVKNQDVKTLCGHNRQKIKHIISKSGAWIGVHNKAKQNYSIVEVAGDGEKVDAAIEMITRFMGIDDTGAISMTTNEEIENSSIPTSVLLSDEDKCAQQESQNALKFASADDEELLQFLLSQQNCIKGSANNFYIWLVKSEDITTMEELSEAISDDDYIRECLQPGDGVVGVKGFKRKAFKNAVLIFSQMKL